MSLEAINKLSEAFNAKAHAGGPMAFYDATVTAVDANAYTCDVLMDDLPVYDIRLRAVISSNQSIDVLPAQNAAVVIGKLGEGDYMLVAADQISSWRITTGTSVLKVDATGLLLAKGTDTLHSVLTDLVTAVLSIAAPKDAATLTALLTRINALLK